VERTRATALATGSVHSTLSRYLIVVSSRGPSGQRDPFDPEPALGGEQADVADRGALRDPEALGELSRRDGTAAREAARDILLDGVEPAGDHRSVQQRQ
jgi:hypothetical protein